MYPRAFSIKGQKKFTPSSHQEAAPTLRDAKNTGAVEDDGESRGIVNNGRPEGIDDAEGP